MKAEKRKRLAAAGWAGTAVQDFLNLSEADVQYIEMKLARIRLLRSAREHRQLAQKKASTLLKIRNRRLRQ